MEVYINDVSHMVSDEYTFIVTKRNTSQVHNAASVVVYEDLMATCPAETELRNLLVKRLDSKKKTGVSRLSSLAVCVICSHGYTINTNTIHGLTHKDMLTVWGVIETSTISSSLELSSWICTAVGNRSQNGYVVYSEDYINVDKLPQQTTTKRKSTIVRSRGKARELNPDVISIHFGDTPTIMDTVLADSNLLQHIRFINDDHQPTTVGPTWLS